MSQKQKLPNRTSTNLPFSKAQNDAMGIIEAKQRLEELKVLVGERAHLDIDSSIRIVRSWMNKD